MKQESVESRKLLYTHIEKYFVFTSFLDYLLSTIEVDQNSDYEKSVWTCFNAFCQSSLSYIMSVYEDLRYENYDFLPKSNANRLLLRNCIEANLILNVLENKPELATNYYATLASDQQRINDLYSPTEADEEKEKKHFMKRFSWLPRFQGKKAKSMSDLLNYVDFESEQQRNEYKIVIKNFDTFIHPSFNFVQSVSEEKTSGSIIGVIALFTDNGIFYDTSYNLLLLFKAIYASTFKSSVFEILEDIISNPAYNSFYFPVDKKELLTIKYDNESKISVLTGVYSTFNIQRHYQRLTGLSPDYLGGIPYIIGLIANYICKYTLVSYKTRNIIFLLRDLTPRYDDMLRAVYEHNPVLFYTQSRYVVEALSILNVLLLEDDERSKIYAIHQRIKSFDARISAAKFINENSESVALPLRTEIDDKAIDNQHEKDIQIVTDYYQNKFNITVERRNIERLNGWALYLTKTNNANVPNSPYFVKLLCDCYYPNDNQSISTLLLALFEESNAFTHVTPYGFSHNHQNFDLSSPLIFINDIAVRLILNLIRIYDLERKLSKEQITEIEVGFFKAMEAIKNNSIKNKKKSSN
ncbi:MAG: hypothetical protein WC196_02145 [Bacilli bacterium]|nr:hypothetical protein [Bacilli bacterium]MDD3422237.1 hypothetical protein [Bacilli bacterium]MDD4065837.1 hypothetical protein [Bacilli bacterium]